MEQVPLVTGSPPHTWRIQDGLVFDLTEDGITSTYVENTLESFQWALVSQDHLHIRGEYIILKMVLNSLIGSPPHTWRIPKFFNSKVTFDRITSTYVENTY